MFRGEPSVTDAHAMVRALCLALGGPLLGDVGGMGEALHDLCLVLVDLLLGLWVSMNATWG